MEHWIAIVDDDETNLKIAGRILGKHDMRVTSFTSGKELLSFMENERPDLILLDIMMPDMDGFETMKRLREMEKENQFEETPVIFLTADEGRDSEIQSFSIGVSDYIRKPFDPEVLMSRIENVLAKQQQMITFKEEATRDKLTGFLNKAATNDKLEALLKRCDGFLMMIDMDSFKLVNDLYGHDMGDEVLLAFARVLRKCLDDDAVIGRVGGDEFTAFSGSIRSEDDLKAVCNELNNGIVEEAKKLMGDDMNLPLGVSMGAVYISGNDASYLELLKNADDALYHVKQNGKHGCYLFGKNQREARGMSGDIDLKTLSTLFAERNIANSALRLDKDEFISVYRYVMRYIMRYHRNACKVMFTLAPGKVQGRDEYDELCEKFGVSIGTVLRKSDLIMQYKLNQYFVLLTDIKEEAVDQVVGSVIRYWTERYKDNLGISYEVEFIEAEQLEYNDRDQLWVVVVDDDMLNLKVAGRTLSRSNMRVTALNSGEALLEFIGDKRPDLILLDINMPGMDGFETLKRLRAEETEIADIPVVFLTAEGDADYEKRGLGLGAMDFIRKPFVPEVLALRVRQIVELIRLQKNLAQEVENKTRQNEKMFLDLVQSLAGAIDAKDAYTNGHSSRVAYYTREIARRYGYNTNEQGDIYIMGLLHDVGKIGIPDAVINKVGRLTDSEYEIMKNHPVIGSKILQNIDEMPKLSIGARYHHERYDGKGYPDGLEGENIPEEARIIAVADAYDAMTSNRSYRDALPQEKVREEIEKGKGNQFDPVFADIMLKMIDEDKEYKMREM